MNRSLRMVLVIIGILSLILVAGFCLQLPWATSIWPWAHSFPVYTFLGAITAASAASILWIGLSGELGTAVGGAIDLVVFYAGITISLFLLFQMNGDQRLFIGSLVSVIGVLVSISIFLAFRRYPIHDSQPMPRLVRISFGIFAGILLFVGSAILLQVPNIFAWNLIPTTSALIGCFFLGSACYFIYGLWRPIWANACGQLWAFLAYDIVLIGPFLLHFATVSPAQQPSLIINTAVLIYSGALAIYYLLIHKTTRIWGKDRSTVHFLKTEPFRKRI